MRIRTSPTVLLFITFVVTAAAGSVRAAGTVRLELVGDSRGSALAFQEWSQALGKAGIRNVRIRSEEEAGKPRIEVQGTESNPVYVVTGIIRSRQEIELPGRRFRRGEIGRLAQWLKDLADNGPPSTRPKRGVFGLTAAQFERVRKDLAEPVGFDTRGMTRRGAIEKLAARLNPPLTIDSRVAAVLGNDELDEKLGGLAGGTVLAYLLRSAGLGFAPRASGGEIGYELTPARQGVESWPVGTDADDSARELLPALFEFHNVNVQNVSAAKAVEAIGKRLDAPVLIDRNSLKKHEIDPEKALVSLPQSKTTYSLALRKLLFQAGLKFQVRRDDAGKPLLWVTTIKPH
ncbi:MAG: hypothetical protein JW719_11540 [Pirellulales bacterium]|nr:hypothetical protein [Pirellulales bacterium]